MDLRIREICKDKGETITGLAEKINISKGALSQAINGNPTVGTLQKISDALDVSLIELFAANCPKCGARLGEVTEATTPPPPAPKPKTDNGLLEFIETCADKMPDGIGLIGLKKHLKAYGDVPINQIDEKYRVGFIEYLQTGKRQNGWKVISEMYQKRMKACFDEVIALLPDRKKIAA